MHNAVNTHAQQKVENCERDSDSSESQDENNAVNDSVEDDCIGVEMPEGTEVVLEVSGKKFKGNLPNIPPCSLTGEEAENLVKEFMRESNVILFLKNSFELTELENCEGKVIGTNFPQGGSVSTGDSLTFIIGSTTKD